MKRNPFSLTALVLSVAMIGLCLFADRHPLSPPIVHAEFIRQAAVSSGTPQTFYKLLQTVAYQGPAFLDEATICNLSSNANTLYLGTESNTNAASGLPIEPGACFSWHAAQKSIDSQQIYLFVSVTQNAAVSVRQR